MHSNRVLVAALIALAGCGDDDEASGGGPKGGVDAAVDAALDAGRDANLDASDGLPPALASSLAAWNALAAASPGPYWFEEENCLINAQSGGSTIVQVEQGSGRAVGSRSYPRSECRALVNRFGAVASTLPALHTQCASLLARRADARLAFDGQGVVSQCWVPDAPNCKDNCGEGFYLLARGFGIAAIPDAGSSDAGR